MDKSTDVHIRTMIHNNAINFKIATNDIFDGFRLGNYFLRNNFVLQVRYEGQQ